jgi:hypothetical protein
MKQIPFTNQTFNEQLSDLNNSDDRSYFERKSQSLISWLDWLKNQHLISDKQFNESLRKLNEIKSSRFSTRSIINSKSDRSNKDIFSFFLNFKFLTLSFIFLLIIFNIYIYSLYSSLSNELINKQSKGRVLPFKGVIKDTDGKPLDTKRDATFSLYSIARGGTPLYTGKCLGEAGLQPQFNGSFTILVGSDCEMKPIPENIFQENSTLYLGMTIGSESELLPRYQIFTTTYSKDTSKLQGLELGKSNSSIPYIDEEGRIEIEGSSPTLKSTNGIFSIEGETLSIKAKDPKDGDIEIQPGSESNVIIPYGKLAIGSYEPDSILDVQATQLFASTASINNFAIPDDENTSVLRLSLGTEKNAIKSNFIEFFAGSSSTNPGEKVGDIRINNEAVVYETAGADFAEYFTLSDQSEIFTGSIISISSKGLHSSVPNEKIIGVTSATAGFVGNKKDSKSNSVLIALVGQVDVLVSSINGEIKTGSRIGASIIPGYGGLVSSDGFSVGYVLESGSVENYSNDKCPKSYKNRRDRSGKKISCGIAKIVLDLE